MQNFVFHNPTKVLFGRGMLAQLGAETSAHGKNVLLVSGRNHARESGLIERIINNLQEHQLKVFEFEGVQPNPLLGHVQAGVSFAKENQIDVICGVGGGSVIDSAKAIAAGALVDHDVWKFFTGKKSIKQALPVIAVSTLAASGSEMNSGMVLTRERSQQKFGFAHRLLYPKVAFMDPELTFSVPARHTAYGGVDALAHLLEFYLTSSGGTPVQDRYMECLAASIMQCCSQAIANPSSYEARAGLMWAAALALNGLSAAGLGKVGFPMHLIEHSLSALYDVPHGAGLSVVIPGWLKCNLEAGNRRIPKLFNALFGGPEGSGQSADREGIEGLMSWFRSIQTPLSLPELGISEKDIPMIAENSLALAKVWRMREYDQHTVEKILHRCL